MKIKIKTWNPEKGWSLIEDSRELTQPSLVFAFGSRDLLADKSVIKPLLEEYRESQLIFCSTSGEIVGSEVLEDSISVTELEFDHTGIRTGRVNLRDMENSYEAGRKILDSLPSENLSHIFLVSDGQLINGSELVSGICSRLNKEVPITGGLAGDGYRFEKTLVGLNDYPDTGELVAVGFYGDRIKVGYGTWGGWDAFGPERKITRSSGNILYELDGQSALSLYKKYLGPAADDLPGSAFFFPLSVRSKDQTEGVVRTILSIDEETQSMTFAGEIPMNGFARLMKHNEDKLIDGAEVAGQLSMSSSKANLHPQYGMLISCVGRKIVLGQNIEDEIEVIREAIAPSVPVSGFYSYGEIAPLRNTVVCELHNQTMTVTLFSEE